MRSWVVAETPTYGPMAALLHCAQMLWRRAVGEAGAVEWLLSWDCTTSLHDWSVTVAEREFASVGKGAARGDRFSTIVVRCHCRCLCHKTKGPVSKVFVTFELWTRPVSKCLTTLLG
jgi:hypothetical protein